MEKERIEQGIIGESMAGEKVKCFISVVEDQYYFGYREVFTKKIINFHRTKNLTAAVERVIDHAILQGK